MDLQHDLAEVTLRGVPAARIEVLAAVGAPRIGGLVKQRAPAGSEPACRVQSGHGTEP